jgi:peptidase E
MGGGGFLMEPDNPLLDRFVLSTAAVPKPKICFLGTATGDYQGFIDSFYACFNPQPCIPTHLSLFKPPTRDLRDFVLEQDAIYVGGGNTRAMLALWREWGLDAILRDAWLAGIVMAGLSAGSICWFKQGLSDSVVAGELHPIKCLGFLRGSHCPHYDGEPYRQPTYRHLIKEGKLESGYAADDGAALHFVGEELVGVVSSREAAKAYSVRCVGSEVEETALPAKWLGA